MTILALELSDSRFDSTRLGYSSSRRKSQMQQSFTSRSWPRNQRTLTPTCALQFLRNKEATQSGLWTTRIKLARTTLKSLATVCRPILCALRRCFSKTPALSRSPNRNTTMQSKSARVKTRMRAAPSLILRIGALHNAVKTLSTKSST